MATKNDVTGDTIQTRTLSKQGRDNWDNIFGKKDSKERQQDDGVDSKQISDDAVTEK